MGGGGKQDRGKSSMTRVYFAGQVECRDFYRVVTSFRLKQSFKIIESNHYKCFLNVLITEGLDYLLFVSAGRRDSKLLNKYHYVKGFKPLHICNPSKCAKTPKALIRFLIIIVVLLLWKGELMPTTKHSNLAAFSETSQFVIGVIKLQWNIFFQSSFELI